MPKGIPNWLWELSMNVVVNARVVDDKECGGESYIVPGDDIEDLREALEFVKKGRLEHGADQG